MFRSRQRATIPQDVAEFVKLTTADGELSDHDVDEIVHFIRENHADDPLDEDQLKAVADLTMESASKSFTKSVPLPWKIAGALIALESFAALFPAFEATRDLLELIGEGALDEMAATSVVLLVLAFVLFIAYTALSVVLGVRLLRNRRTGAASIIKAIAAILCCSLVVNVMLSGIDTGTLVLIAVLVLFVIFACYLNHSMRHETDLRYQLLMLDTENRAKNNVLGLNLKGKGYAKLDFVNLFWIFVIGCVVGIIVETIFTMTVTHPGVYENRTGLLFGPFSPIYGVGGVLMTIALNRWQNSNIVFVFVVCTIIGGGFEYFVSWFMEVGFGAKAWDYHGQFLGDLFDGRTCLLFASMFGALGTFHIKVLLPLVVKLINKIPWKWRYVVTGICAAFMLVNCLMTVQALDCWYGRVSGKEPITPTEQFYADNYDNEWMQNHFQTMKITPESSARTQ